MAPLEIVATRDRLGALKRRRSQLEESLQHGEQTRCQAKHAAACWTADRDTAPAARARAQEASLGNGLRADRLRCREVEMAEAYARADDRLAAAAQAAQWTALAPEVSRLQLDLLRDLVEVLSPAVESQVDRQGYQHRVPRLLGLVVPEVMPLGLRECDMELASKYSAALGYMLVLLCSAARLLDAPMPIGSKYLGSWSFVWQPSVAGQRAPRSPAEVSVLYPCSTQHGAAASLFAGGGATNGEFFNDHHLWVSSDGLLRLPTAGLRALRKASRMLMADLTGADGPAAFHALLTELLARTGGGVGDTAAAAGGLSESVSWVARELRESTWGSPQHRRQAARSGPGLPPSQLAASQLLPQLRAPGRAADPDADISEEEGGWGLLPRLALEALALFCALG